MDGDLDWDLDDFGIFKAAFDTAKSPPAIAGMLASIPEPGSIALFVIAGVVDERERIRRHIAVLLLFGAAMIVHGSGPAQAGEVLPGFIGGDLTNPDDAGPPDVTVTAGDTIPTSPVAESPPMALDNNINTKWLSFIPNGTFYQIQFNGGVQNAVNTYTITSANDAETVIPIAGRSADQMTARISPWLTHSRHKHLATACKRRSFWWAIRRRTTTTDLIS